MNIGQEGSSKAKRDILNESIREFHLPPVLLRQGESGDHQGMRMNETDHSTFHTAIQMIDGVALCLFARPGTGTYIPVLCTADQYLPFVDHTYASQPQLRRTVLLGMARKTVSRPTDGHLLLLQPNKLEPQPI